MKVNALTIALLMLVLMAFAGVFSRKTGQISPPTHDLSYTDLFRSSESGKTVARACGNCHSNQTNLPWYGRVAPISWWIKRHVREGREALNFSDWTTYSAGRRLNELELICGVVSNGRMPPASYQVLHPESRLTAQDKQVICAWTADELQHEKSPRSLEAHF